MWRFTTRKGIFYIRWTPEHRYEVVFKGKGLGSYPSPAAAADDLAGGHTFTPGFDTASLGIPADIAEWEFVPRGRLAREGSD